MSLISLKQLVKNCANAYRTASGTSALVRYDELASKIESLSGGETVDVNVKFKVNDELYHFVSTVLGNKVYAPYLPPTPPTGQYMLGWYVGDTKQQFGYDYKTPLEYSTDTIINARFSSSIKNMLYSHYNISSADYSYIVVARASNIVSINFCNSGWTTTSGIAVTNVCKYKNFFDYASSDDLNEIVTFILEKSPNLYDISDRSYTISEGYTFFAVPQDFNTSSGVPQGEGIVFETFN